MREGKPLEAIELVDTSIGEQRGDEAQRQADTLLRSKSAAGAIQEAKRRLRNHTRNERKRQIEHYLQTVAILEGMAKEALSDPDGAQADAAALPRNHGCEGTWNIIETSEWAAERFITGECQSHICIDTNGVGTLQFGSLSAEISGGPVDHPRGRRYEFRWEGADELFAIDGDGWMRRKTETLCDGHIHFHTGSEAVFLAEKQEATPTP